MSDLLVEQEAHPCGDEGGHEVVNPPENVEQHQLEANLWGFRLRL